MGGIANGLWLSSGYWVFDRTPGGQGSNNDRINGQGTMRMSAPRGAAVAFELPSDACVIVLSTTLLWKALTCLLVDLLFSVFFPTSYCVYRTAIHRSHHWMSERRRVVMFKEWQVEVYLPHRPVAPLMFPSAIQLGISLLNIIPGLALCAKYAQHWT